MGELRRRMEMDMDLQNFAVETKRNYLYHATRFVQHFGRSPEKMGVEEIRTYLHHLIVERRLSRAYVSQTYSALKFPYETTMGKTRDLNQTHSSEIPFHHLRTMHAIEACRTPQPGGHLYQCDHCGELIPLLQKQTLSHLPVLAHPTMDPRQGTEPAAHPLLPCLRQAGTSSSHSPSNSDPSP